MSEQERETPTYQFVDGAPFFTQEAFTRLQVCGVWEMSPAGTVAAIAGSRTCFPTCVFESGIITSAGERPDEWLRSCTMGNYVRYTAMD